MLVATRAVRDGPVKSCAECALQDCAGADDQMTGAGGQCLQQVVEEAPRLHGRTANSGASHGHADHSFALVCYATDATALSALPEQKFYGIISRALQMRKEGLLAYLQGYLHHLLSAVEAIPPLSRRVLYRGIPAEKRTMVTERYRVGATICWSTLASLSEDKAVAERFAGKDGVLSCMCKRRPRAAFGSSQRPQRMRRRCSCPASRPLSRRLWLMASMTMGTSTSRR